MDPQHKALTIRYIDSIKPPQLPIRCVDYPDGVVEGLKLRVTFRGVESWALRYRVGTRKPRIKLGRYPRITLERARKRARVALAKVDRDGIRLPSGRPGLKPLVGCQPRLRRLPGSSLPISVW
jgi:hypothetical protein